MLSNQEIQMILEEAGVLQTGHFLLTSGRHSEKYLQCANIFKNTKYSEKLCKQLYENLKGHQMDIVIGPAIGAILMSYEVSKYFGVENLFTERNKDGEMFLGRGFEIKKGLKVLIVEDVITTGGSVKEVIQVVKSNYADVIGVGCIVDRTNGNVDFGVPLTSVISVDVKSFDPKSCPICQEKNIPLIKPGSRVFN